MLAQSIGLSVKFCEYKCVVTMLLHRTNLVRIYIQFHRQFTTNTVISTQTQNANRPRQVMSGIQPTGTLHLGNYLCAIKQWCNEQQSYINQSLADDTTIRVNKPIYSIVDLHAITVRQNPVHLRQHCVNMTATLLACGMSPESRVIFSQSHVPTHTELQWLLSCITPQVWLNKMTQYKYKSMKLRSTSSNASITLGLYL